MKKEKNNKKIADFSNNFFVGGKFFYKWKNYITEELKTEIEKTVFYRKWKVKF